MCEALRAADRCFYNPLERIKAYISMQRKKKHVELLIHPRSSTSIKRNVNLLDFKQNSVFVCVNAI